MMNYRKTSACAVLAMAAGAIVPLLASQPAHARVCGGLNQRACPKILPGPQCKSGLIIVNKRCVRTRVLPRPGIPKRCGGLRQPACPKVLPGPECRAGLKKVRGICLPASRPPKPKPTPIRCGGLNQRACPKFLPGPECKAGLRKVRGFCVRQTVRPIPVPAPPGGGAASSVNERAKRAARSASSHIAILKKFGRCIGRGRNRKEFISASKKADSDKAARINQRCLSRSDRRRLASSSVDDGRGGRVRFRSYSVGFGASLAAIVGAGADAGWVFDLSGRVGPRFYTAGMGGVGLQLMGGADVLINLSVDAVLPGVTKYSGSITAFDAGPGIGIGFITTRSKRMLNAPFKGIEVAIGVAGAGGSIGAKYSIRQRLWRKACKGVTVRVVNRTGRDIKIIDLDYRDKLKRKWRSEPTPNKVVAPNKSWSTNRWFGKIGDEPTQFKIKYKVREGSGWKKWSDLRDYRKSTALCRNGDTYSMEIR